MKPQSKKIHLAAIGAFTALFLAAPPLSIAGQQGQTKGDLDPPSSVTGNASTSAAVHPSDKKPGPAWRTIGGTVKQMKDTVYTIEDYEGNSVQLFVSKQTKQLGGRKKIGDHVRAEITHSGFANSIQ